MCVCVCVCVCVKELWECRVVQFCQDVKYGGGGAAGKAGKDSKALVPKRQIFISRTKVA